MELCPTTRLLLNDEMTPVDRLEVPEGRTGRHSWLDDLNVLIMQTRFEPGAGARDVAERHGLAPQHLSTWRSQARRGKHSLPIAEADLPACARIEVTSEAAPISRTMIEIEIQAPRGGQIRLARHQRRGNAAPQSPVPGARLAQGLWPAGPGTVCGRLTQGRLHRQRAFDPKPKCGLWGPIRKISI